MLSSPAIVIILFASFALAAVAFAAALSPFFANAKVAAVIGPLALFITAQVLRTTDAEYTLSSCGCACFLTKPSPALACTQFINFFIDTQTGILKEGNPRGKALASLFPGCAFYLGANRLALYEVRKNASTSYTRGTAHGLC